MPCTTTQKTMWPTIIEISLRKPSLSTLSCTAKAGTAMPSTMPSASAASTWTNSDWYSGDAGLGGAADRGSELADMVDSLVQRWKGKRGRASSRAERERRREGVSERPGRVEGR